MTSDEPRDEDVRGTEPGGETGADGFPEDPSPEGSPAGQNGEPDPGFLELIYGVLFDPVKTFRRVAESPPAGKIVLIFFIVKALSILLFIAGGLSSQNFIFGGFPGLSGREMAGVIRAMAPAAAVFALVYEFLKWFVYSGILYLLAGLSGGRGKAVGVLAATGLASLPALALLPFHILALFLGGGRMPTPFGSLLWLAVMAWGAVLVVLGLRETQGLSTGRAVAVALAPAAVAAAVLLLLLIFMVALAGFLGLPFLQFDDISL